MHAVDRCAGKSCAPEPAVLVKKWSKLQDPAMRLESALRDSVRSEEQINRRSPAVVRERIRVSPLVADGPATELKDQSANHQS